MRRVSNHVERICVITYGPNYAFEPATTCGLLHWQALQWAEDLPCPLCRLLCNGDGSVRQRHVLGLMARGSSMRWWRCYTALSGRLQQR
jgi:hypothetical protein